MQARKKICDMYGKDALSERVSTKNSLLNFVLLSALKF